MTDISALHLAMGFIILIAIGAVAFLSQRSPRSGVLRLGIALTLAMVLVPFLPEAVCGFIAGWTTAVVFSKVSPAVVQWLHRATTVEKEGNMIL